MSYAVYVYDGYGKLLHLKSYYYAGVDNTWFTADDAYVITHPVAK